MDKRLSTGRLIADRLVIKSFTAGTAAVAACCVYLIVNRGFSQKMRDEESATKAAIAVAKGVLADTAGEPFSGGGANIQRLRGILDEAGKTVALVNRLDESVIQGKSAAAEKRFKNIAKSAKDEAETVLKQLRLQKSEYDSSRRKLRSEFDDGLAAAVREANDVVMEHDTLHKKLKLYRETIEAFVNDGERMSLQNNARHLRNNLNDVDVQDSRLSSAISKATKELQGAWLSLMEVDMGVVGTIDMVESASTRVKPEVDSLKAIAGFVEDSYKKIMSMPVVLSEESQQMYLRQCAAIDGQIRNFMTVPYDYDQAGATSLLALIAKLERDVSVGDERELSELYGRIQQQHKEFVAKCRWRPGVKHPRFPHVVSSSIQGQWSPESGWEFVHPETSDLTVQAKWPNPPDWYQNECRQIRDNVRYYMNGPYYYERLTANWILNKVSELEEKIARRDVSGSVELHKTIKVHYDDFASKCTWRPGMAHPEIKHVVSSTTPHQWSPESGWEFVNPGTTDLTVCRKPPTWEQPKEWYEHTCSVLEQNIGYYTSGGYRYPRGADKKLLRQINVLREYLRKNDPERGVRAYSDLKAAYDTFASQCQWTQGVRHPKYPHVLSSYTANQWVAENGWEFVNPGTSDFTVRRKPVKVTCPQCRGVGHVYESVRCQSCGGNGSVSNPAAQIGDTVGGLFSAFNSGRGGRSLPNVRNLIPSTISCSACNGRGQKQQYKTCSGCNGTGSIYQTSR